MTASAVPASKMLNAYLKDKVTPVLLNAGFKAAGRVYRRPVGDALQIIDIQNWKYNDPQSARFTLEIGVCFPRLLGAVAQLDSYAYYKEGLARPGVTECAVRRRIGDFLEPRQDVWWTVSSTTGHVPAVEDVITPLMAAALPWAQAMSTIPAVVAARAERHALSSAVMDVAALFALGQFSAAGDAAASLARSRHPSQPADLLADLLSLEKLACSHPGEA